MVAEAPRGLGELALAPDPSAVRRAREFVRDETAGFCRPEVVDAASAVVTELVTNALLHARTAVTVRIAAAGAGVRLEVEDRDPGGTVGPSAARAGDGRGVTGRGLLLVEALAERWGVTVDADGKTVWAEIATGMPAEAVVTPPRTPSHPQASDAHPVRLVGVPVRLVAESSSRLDDLRRECGILLLSEDRDADLVPLLSDLADLLDAVALSRQVAAEAAEAAHRAGQRLVDITLAIPPTVIATFWHLLDVVDAASELSRAGRLLTVAPTAEVAAFRRWWCSEIERQVTGSAPKPCPFPVAPAGPPPAPPKPRPEALLEAERSARRSAERAAARLARLQALTADLSRRLNVRDVAAAALAHVVAELGGRSGAVCLLRPDGQTVAIVGHLGYDGQVAGYWAEFSVSADLPASEAIRTGQSVHYRDLAERDARYPLLAAAPTESDPAASVTPLRVEEDRVLGALVVGYSDVSHLADEDGAFIDAAAGHVAHALERARLAEAEDAAAERASFLAEASASLSGSLDLERTFAALVEAAAPRVADWCSVHVVRPDGSLRFAAAGHRDGGVRDAVVEMHRRWPPAPESALRRVAVTGTAALYQVVPEAMLTDAAHDDEHLALLRRMGMSSLAVVPLKAGESVVGVLALANAAGRVITVEDFALAQDLAARGAAAMVNARLFEERSRAAEALQASLLPARLPAVPGLDIAARYVAAAADVDVGGDFYDVFGAGGSWFVAVGDVRGKGVEAAAVTGLARHTIRALARVEPSPSAILGHLNDLLVEAEAGSESAVPRFCTVVLARLDLHPGGGAEVTISVAGHPLPVVRRADGTLRECGVPGSLVGLLDTVALTDTCTPLGPGEALVMFTDGVTERHEGRRFFGEDGLASVLTRARPGAGAAELAETLEAAVRDFDARPPGDDMAVVVVRPVTPGDRSP